MKKNEETKSGFWNLCPVSPRHGYLIVRKNANGGLLAVCEKCYVPSRREKKGGE